MDLVKNYGRLAVAGLLLILCLWLGAPGLVMAEPFYLLLEDEHGKPLLVEPMREGSEFAIAYRHSVALTPVCDFFKLRNGEIWLDKTEYQDFGAGLPHAPEANEKMSQAHGVLTISGYARRLPVFQLRVGRIANHRLLLFGKPGSALRQISLDRLAKPGSAVTFSVASQKPD